MTTERLKEIDRICSDDLGPVVDELIAEVRRLQMGIAGLADSWSERPEAGTDSRARFDAAEEVFAEHADRLRALLDGGSP